MSHTTQHTTPHPHSADNNGKVSHCISTVRRGGFDMFNTEG